MNLALGPVSWLRLAPKFDQGRTWTVAELEEAATNSNFLFPPYGMGRGGYTIRSARSDDGFGTWVAHGRDYRTLWASFIFTTGEIWGVDALTMNIDGALIRFDEAMMVQVLNGYRELLSRLWIDGPYRWTAGMEGTKNRSLAPATATLFLPEGVALTDEILAEGELLGDQETSDAARAYFAKIREACGLSA